MIPVTEHFGTSVRGSPESEEGPRRIDRWIMVRALAAVAIAGLLCTASAGFADTYIVTALTQGLNGSVHDISSTGAVCGGDNGRAFVWRPSTP